MTRTRCWLLISLLGYTALGAGEALGQAEEAEQAVFSFDGADPAAGWSAPKPGRNAQGEEGAVRIEVVEGRAGGKALRFIAQNVGRHRFVSPPIPDGDWRARKYRGLSLWFRGDGSRWDATLVLLMKRDSGAGRPSYIARVHLYDKGWRQVVLSHFTPDAPDLSKLASVQIEGPQTYELTMGAVSLVPAWELTKLKPMHIQTPLLLEGRSAATIVAPPTPLGLDLAARVQKRLKALTQQDFPVMPSDQATPATLLRERHAIVLGCMADNPFYERLYREWFTITDRWYPGPGGYELRSLHSPYGTGRNVILLGASDDAGLRAAVAAFERALEKGVTLPLLMDIKLGQGHEVPADAESVPILLRPFADNAPVANGWSPAGKLALQYYYSGSPTYAERFKQLVKEKPESISQADHYGGGQTQCLIWDLIEESPLFSDDERLAVTRLLLEHLRSGQATAGLDARVIEIETGLLPDRHALTPMQAVVNAARYFNRDYPQPEFARYVEMGDRYFAPLMKASKTQCDIGVGRLTTYLEPQLQYALIKGREDFLRGEPLRLWADRIVAHVPATGVLGLETRERPFITLRTTAQVRRDGQYRYVADLALAAPPVTLYEFTSGQAWAGDVAPVRPSRYDGVVAIPPEPWESRFCEMPVPPERGVDKVTLRTGFSPDDLWLLLEGVDGGPEGKRNRDVNAIKWLGRFGHLFLRTWSGSHYSQNGVCVSRDGLSQELPRNSELVATADLPGFGYVHARTERYPWSHWSRHLVWDKANDWIAVLDRIVATEPGHFLISAHWIPYGSTYMTAEGDVSQEADGFRIVARAADRPPATLHVRNVLGLLRRELTTLTGGEMKAGEERWLMHLLALKPGEDNQPPVTERLAANAFLVKGQVPVVMGVGASPSLFGGSVQVAASAFRLCPQRVSLAGATEFGWKESRLSADKPVDVELNADGSGRIKATQATRVRLSGPEVSVGGRRVTQADELTPGVHEVTGLSWVGSALKDIVSRATPSASPSPLLETVSDAIPAWSPSATAKVPGKPTALAADEDCAILGYEDGAVRAVEPGGRERWSFKAEKNVSGLAVAPADAGVLWRVLVGSDDGHVCALDAQGKLLWKSLLRPDDKGGRRSPYIREFLFTDLTGDGVPEIVAPNSERWLTVLKPNDGSELWATRIPPNYNFGDLMFPRALPTAKGGRHIAVGDVWFYGGGWHRVDAAGKLVRTFGGMWAGGRACGVAVADFDGDGASDVCVARCRVIDTIEFFASGERNAWTVWTDEPVTALVPLARPNSGHLIVAGTRSGWVVALDAKGQVAWRHGFIASVKDLVSLRGGHVAAVLDDGRVLLLDRQGRPRLLAKLAAKDFRLSVPSSQSSLVAAAALGEMVRFDLPKDW